MKKLFIILTLSVPLATLAQSYPSKSIRWVVPYTGGGIAEIAKWAKVITTAGVKAEQ